jgi:recombination protein RecT
MTTALRTAVGLAPAVKEKPTDIFGFLKVYQGEIQRALPSHMTADRMARIVTTEIRKVPKLLGCNVGSLFGAVIQCSQLGLEPGGGLGHAYLIPYGNECQLIIGYRGMIDLARRSGQIVSLAGEAVYANDLFEYELGLEPKLKHVPAQGERGALTHVYAVAKLVGGGFEFKVMSASDVDKIRKRSRASSSGPWVTDYDQMAIKTVIRRLFKYLPVSIELQRAVTLDEAGERGEQRLDDVITGVFSTMESDNPASEPAENAPPAAGNDAGAQQTAPTTQDAPNAPTFAQVADRISHASTSDEVDVAADLIRLVGDPAHKAELTRLAAAQRKSLK